MPSTQEFSTGQQEELQKFVASPTRQDPLVIVAGNPRLQVLGTEGSLVVDNSQVSAVRQALLLYDWSIIQCVLSELSAEGKESLLVKELTGVRNWQHYVRGGAKRAEFPNEILEDSRFGGWANSFLPVLGGLIRDAKNSVRLVTQLDHNSGSSTHKFLLPSAELVLLEKHGGSRASLKAATEKGAVDISALNVRSFPKEMRTGIFSSMMEVSLAHSGDVGVVPEGVIRGFMNNLAEEQDWGEEVNMSKGGGRYCLTRDIYGVDPNDAQRVLVACPGVVSGTLGLIARDVIKTENGNQGRILMFMEEDGIRVNRGEISGGVWFYEERVPHSERAPARFVMTPLMDPTLLRFAQFEQAPTCK
jgi:hypothetical protein